MVTLTCYVRGCRCCATDVAVAVIPRGQVVVLSLARALPGIWNVTMLVSIFWLIFSILGVALFKGKLQTCDIDISLDKDVCLAAGGHWIPDPYISFDSTWLTWKANGRWGCLSGFKDSKLYCFGPAIVRRRWCRCWRSVSGAVSDSHSVGMG